MVCQLHEGLEASALVTGVGVMPPVRKLGPFFTNASTAPWNFLTQERKTCDPGSC